MSNAVLFPREGGGGWGKKCEAKTPDLIDPLGNFPDKYQIKEWNREAVRKL